MPAHHDHRGHDHHDHDHGGRRGHGAVAFLGGAVWIAAAILAAEAVGGLLSHSLALLSDAGHMLTDVLSLVLAWYAARLAHRPATARRTYGYHRAGILAALFNAAVLILVAAAIVVEAVLRLRHPVAVAPDIMLVVAGIGLVGNLVIGLGLGHGHAHGGNLNVRSAWLHVMGDAAASAGVLAAAVLIRFTGRLWLDPVVSAAIALLIARGAWSILRQTVDVLMEGAPTGTDVAAVSAAITADRAVLAVHHVHVWALDGERAALSGHVVLQDVPLSETRAVVARIGDRLRHDFGIDHTTLQLESGLGPCPHGDCAYCGA